MEPGDEAMFMAWFINCFIYGILNRTQNHWLAVSRAYEHCEAVLRIHNQLAPIST